MHNAIHNSFTLERTYPATAARVFAAFKDPVKKARWFVGGEGFLIDSYSFDFQVGGWERFRFRFGADGPPMTNDTIYLEIVPEQRLVFAYSMTIGGNSLSASLTTIELTPSADGKSTRLLFHEHDTFLDGKDGGPSRKEGTEGLLKSLARELERHP
ncbi:MAG: SRPBCC family protein [Archangium sp.]